jgi:ketosteroid isomerase-like protein
MCGSVRARRTLREVNPEMANDADQQTIDEVLAAEAARLHAIETRDWDALDRLLGDDLSYVHSDTGLYEDKAANLATLHASPRSYIRRDLRVRPYGDVAVLTGEIDITIDAIQDVSPEQHIFSFATQVWVKRDGHWQMVVFQATMIKAKNAPVS